MTLLSEGTQNLVNAMQVASIRRLICITGMGASDSRDHGGFRYDRLFLPLLLGQIYVDKDRQETIVCDTDLDWPIVRPARLTDAPGWYAYRRITRFKPGERMRSIARSDVAHFIVEELRTPTQHREWVNLRD